MSIRKYFNRDFTFIKEYIFEFKEELSVSIKNELQLYFKKQHIATFTLAVSDESMRLYKIIFHPEFAMIPEELYQSPKTELHNIYRNFKIDEAQDYSVTVGPELLHLWCHKLIWEAVETIGYKTLQ